MWDNEWAINGLLSVFDLHTAVVVTSTHELSVLSVSVVAI